MVEIIWLPKEHTNVLTLAVVSNRGLRPTTKLAEKCHYHIRYRWRNNDRYHDTSRYKRLRYQNQGQQHFLFRSCISFCLADIDPTTLDR